MSRPRRKTPVPKRKRLSSTMPHADYLRALLDQMEVDTEGAREAGSWQAVAALQRQAVAARRELADLERAEPQSADPFAAMTPAELVGALVELIPRLPDAAVEALHEALAARL